MSIAESLKNQNLTELDATVIAEAINDLMQGKTPRLSAEEANQIIHNHLEEKRSDAFMANKTEGENFLANNKSKERIQETATGLQYEILTEGDGQKPTSTDVVSVHYHGTLIDGTVFDSSSNSRMDRSFTIEERWLKIPFVYSSKSCLWRKSTPRRTNSTV
jgi:FKBP-type peptidyl-prolyl cis-trans isomerase FklB